MKNKSIQFIVAIISLISVATCHAQSLAFEGALGFGKYTQGGNQGKVLVVTSLSDNAKSPQKGTLRWAIAQNYPRLIVFNVSGVIVLEKELEIKHDSVTIAGQTSPHGIVISGASTSVEANQVIIRHMRFRPGKDSEEGDAVTVRNTADVIIDHCSLSWSKDEVGSFYNNQRFTLQNSILSESLNNAGHHKGSHGYGGIWGGSYASFLRNVLANHTSRNPRINGWRLNPPYPQQQEFVDIRNNVIANWQKNSAYGGEDGIANLVGNVYIPGPATKKIWFFQLWDDQKSLTRLYVAENMMKGHSEMSGNNTKGIDVKGAKTGSEKEKAVSTRSLSTAPFHQEKIDKLGDTQLTTQQTWASLIENREVGANLTRTGRGLDPVDSRILKQIQDNQYKSKNGIIDSELEVIDWTSYRSYFTADTAPSLTFHEENSWRIIAGIPPL
ncbi:pectate lyase C [Alteromonas mediterranea]|uniref:Pectate lyase C n=1 Tax=Alteromonas mediterranea TaxID=314275 RepID=A0AAC9NTK3_9ALTE|nr:pectate lyase C [Alteromonas mediterranea]APD91457.1 pectate lyase C [Alteromonas mediterranea]